MAISQAVPLSYKLELLQGIHDFRTDVVKCALFTNTATMNHLTTAYSSAGECSATGYTAGGQVCTLSAGYPRIDGATGAVRFDDLTWLGSSIGADGALLYNVSKANRAILVIGFPATQSSINGKFTLRFPTQLNPILQVA